MAGYSVDREHYIFLRKPANTNSSDAVLVIHDIKRELDLEYEINRNQQIIFLKFLLDYILKI